MTRDAGNKQECLPFRDFKHHCCNGLQFLFLGENFPGVARIPKHVWFFCYTSDDMALRYATIRQTDCIHELLFPAPLAAAHVQLWPLTHFRWAMQSVSSCFHVVSLLPSEAQLIHSSSKALKSIAIPQQTMLRAACCRIRSLPSCEEFRNLLSHHRI